MNWLAYLQSWFDRNMLGWKQRGIEAAISLPTKNSDKNGIYVDFDTVDYIGRIAIWESGECDMEILNVDSGDNRFWENFKFKKEEEADQAVTEFIEHLSRSRSGSG